MAATIDIKRYTPAHQAEWDQFVHGSKNGTFLFFRDYMEYHADRFPDFSLLFWQKGKLAALLPASLSGSTLSSHGGLTYGGLLLLPQTKMKTVLAVFEALLEHLQRKGIEKVVYKAIPHIYHQAPAEEDLYVLFRLGARLFRRDVSSIIDFSNPVPFSRNRQYALRQPLSAEITIRPSTDFARFMELERQVLEQKYSLRPTHSTEEMEALARLFPHHIKLFAAYSSGEMVAGTIVYETAQVAHTQYIAVADPGRNGASELLLDRVMQEYRNRKRYFSFGISTEQNGRHLNEGLLQFKESFGARAVGHDFYEWDL